MLRLRNHLSPLLRAASSLLSPTHHHRACLLLSTSTFTSTSTAPFSLEDYLVAACGFAPDQARKASKKAFEEASRDCKKPFEELSRSRLNTASNPDAVLALLSGIGLSRADIAAVVSADPLILRSSVKIIGPRLVALRDQLGLSTHQIYRFLLVGSRALRRSDVLPTLEFFISFFGSFEHALVAVKRSYLILWGDLDRLVKPNIAQFLQCGLSARDTVQMCSRYPRLLVFNPERVKDCFLYVDELGVPRSSHMFKYAVAVVASTGKEKVAARFDLLKTALGCSVSQVAIAVSRLPTILGISEERLLAKIQFLLNEVRLEPQYIVQRPALLGYSLEKRLVPRHQVIKFLQAKGLLNNDLSFYTVAQSEERAFRLKFIDCHKDSVPGLADAYAAATVGGTPLGSPSLTSL